MDSSFSLFDGAVSGNYPEQQIGSHADDNNGVQMAS
jgi:hypothetical protein